MQIFQRKFNLFLIRYCIIHFFVVSLHTDKITIKTNKTMKTYNSNIHKVVDVYCNEVIYYGSYDACREFIIKQGDRSQYKIIPI